MPLTAKEKMRAYREKLKEDKEKYENVKEKDRLRKLNMFNNMTNTAKTIHRRLNKSRVQKHRKLKQEEEVRKHSLPIQSTPQSIGKAKQRVKRNLPKSPRKRKAIVKILAEEEGILKTSTTPRKLQSRGLDPNTLEKVNQFYRESTWVCPGLKDCVTIRSEAGKQHIQKHYLLTTLKEAYAMFRQEFPEAKICFSKFASLRPQYVLLQDSIPENTCLCRYHENIKLLLEALKNYLSFPVEFRPFLNEIVCDQFSEQCMESKCSKCPKMSQFKLGDDENNFICWKQWENMNGKTELVRKEGTVVDCVKNLTNQLPYFLHHTFVKRNQSTSFKISRETVLVNKNKVVIQIDFSENYATKGQNEIQSAYWSHEQIALFTTCAWSHKGVLSIIVASDYLAHDKYATCTFIQIIMEHIENEWGKFSTIEIFSDGAASHFKQKFTLQNITFLNFKEVSWQFFATGHGKGVVDGIGGQIKRFVRRQVMSGGVTVQNLEDFVKVASMNDGKTTVLECQENKVTLNKARLDKQWICIKAIPKLQTVHYVRAMKQNVIETKSWTSSCDGSIHDFTTETEDNEMALQANGGDQRSNGDEEIIESPDCGKNSWVLVQYARKNKKLHYVGKIVSIEDFMYKVSFLSMKKKYQFVWPTVTDEDFVPRCDVVKVLPEPEIDRRGETLTFGVCFDDFDMK